MELFDEAWTCDTPSKLLERIVESKMSYLIFDVVLHQKFDNFSAFLIISNIKITPLEACGQSYRLFGNLILRELFNLTFFEFLHFGQLNGLRFPKLVLAADGDQVLESVALKEMNAVVLRDLPKPVKHLVFGEARILGVKTQLFHCCLKVVGCLHFSFNV